jgi:hypothetical protein
VLDAERDYAANPDEVIVRVYICGSQTFSFAQPPLGPGKEPWGPKDYLKGFDFQVSQTRAIKVKKSTERKALLGCPDFDAFEAFLYFDADQFIAGPVKIDVIAPTGQIFTTTFDLRQLK